MRHDLKYDLQQASIKKRYKMWKSKKQWVVAALLFVGLAGAATFAEVQTVSATDPVPTTAPAFVAADLNADFSVANGWTKMTAVPAVGTLLATGAFTASEVNYSATISMPSTASNPLFNNAIKKTTESAVHYYSFSKGTSNTSRYYMFPIESDNKMFTYTVQGTPNMYKKTDAAGVVTIAKVINASPAMQIAETVQITASGKISHSMTILNTANTTLLKQIYGTYLDTMLDKADDIEIRSDGKGGIYIQNDQITLFCTPGSNVKVLSGKYSNTGGHL